MLESNPVSQKGAAGKWAGWIDSQDPYTFVLLSQESRQLADKSAFAGSGRSSNANNMGITRVRMCSLENRCSIFSPLFHLREQTGQGGYVTRSHMPNLIMDLMRTYVAVVP